MTTGARGGRLLLALALPVLGACAASTPLDMGSRKAVPEGEILGYEPIERVEKPARKAPLPAAGAAPSPARDEAAVAEIGGDPIPLEALRDFLLRHYVAECYEAADALVEAELVRRESERLEAPSVDPGPIDAAVAGAVAELARRVAPGAPEGDLSGLEAHLGGLGKSLESYTSELREAAERRLRLARLARYEEMTSDTVTLQEVVFLDLAAAESALADLAQGADFGRLAAHRSSAPTAMAQGKLPAAPLADLDPAVRDAVAALGPRETSGVVAVATPRGARFAIYRLLDRRQGLVTSDAEARARAWSAVAASLEAKPVGDDEILRWTRRNHKRYDVRVNLAPRSSE